MVHGTQQSFNYFLEKLMNESVTNASRRVGDWRIPTSVWQVSICVGERGVKTIHGRHLAQISILLHILGRPLKFCRKFHSEDGWMERGAESIFQRIDFFFFPILWVTSIKRWTQITTEEPCTHSLIHQGKGMSGTRQVQVQVLTPPLSSSVAFSQWGSVFHNSNVK